MCSEALIAEAGDLRVLQPALIPGVNVGGFEGSQVQPIRVELHKRAMIEQVPSVSLVVVSKQSWLPYGRQTITPADEQAMLDCLRGDFLTQGPAVPAFEAALADACQAPDAVAFNSATSALHAACLALDLGPGDRLWTSPISFVASANCGLYCGAHVEFVDIDPATALISLPSLEQRLQQAELDGTLPKVLVPVHLVGTSCPMAQLTALADRYGFRILEDASHAVGASYEGSPVGSGHYSAITDFSFHPVKIITTGEGGAALSRDPQLVERLRRLRSHGISRDSFEQISPGPWYYEQQELGFNYRLTDLQASLGLSQLSCARLWIGGGANGSLSPNGAWIAVAF